MAQINLESPYLDWIISHLNIYEYRKSYTYDTSDQCTIGSHVYMSLCDNNLGNYPVNSNFWTKII